jgi:hypothetical protein
VHSMHLLRHAFGTFDGTVTQAKRIKELWKVAQRFFPTCIR